MLFFGLVEPKKDDDSDYDSDGTESSSSSLDDEPEPPLLLEIAEKALRYLRDAKQTDALALLRENGLRWVRKRDFWIMQGGPITDTALMAGVRLPDG